jgi:hypothetical protein
MERSGVWNSPLVVNQLWILVWTCFAIQCVGRSRAQEHADPEVKVRNLFSVCLVHCVESTGEVGKGSGIPMNA